MAPTEKTHLLSLLQKPASAPFQAAPQQPAIPRGAGKTRIMTEIIHAFLHSEFKRHLPYFKMF
jgi:hypothetical protein